MSGRFYRRADGRRPFERPDQHPEWESDMKQVIQHLLSFKPTRIGLALALFVPFLFTVI
jgi:hypothetical protein